ncbi:MAG: hypothetical protein IJX86_04820 [Lachnospiraceae bacterium]|nr:hypothetical protein [Lachnospiraceae bacterium]MBR3683319.1 hypothetical protein [Lachnospiraceae bacterium]
MELKKSYKGFVIWLIAFLAVMIGTVFLPIEDYELMTRITYNIPAIFVSLLAFIILKTENVYWYNGISFEQAVAAGSLRRREYAGRHFKRFKIFSDVFLLFSIVAQSLGFSHWIDFAVLFGGIIAVAISTVKIEL